MKKPRKDSSLFQLIDQKTFQALVDKWDMDKWARGFKTWEMTCALISAMMMRLATYREIESALGIPKSTLGDAMKKRCHGFFEDLCDQILLSIRLRTKDRKIKRAVRELLALDSSEIRVHGSLFKYTNWLQMTKSKKSDQRNFLKLQVHAVEIGLMRCFRCSPEFFRNQRILINPNEKRLLQ